MDGQIQMRSAQEDDRTAKAVLGERTCCLLNLACFSQNKHHCSLVMPVREWAQTPMKYIIICMGSILQRGVCNLTFVQACVSPAMEIACIFFRISPLQPVNPKGATQLYFFFSITIQLHTAVNLHS